MDVNDILKERQKTHGDFEIHAEISQFLKTIIRQNGELLTSDKAEALDMIAHKIARILAGDPSHIDHWADIAGYAQLIVNDLEGRKLTEE